MSTWRLPEGIDELTGSKALKFESIRRQLLDLYHNKGFELVIPPMVENVESLLLKSESLNLKTFKFLDPSSGKMLGVHADITPQISRIDAKLSTDKIKKYCYINSILQVKSNDFYASRSPIQAGAEFYGSKDISTDIEIIKLMVDSLEVLMIHPLTLSIGNVAIFNALMAKESFSEQQAAQLKQTFQRRSIPDLKAFLKANTVNNASKFQKLISLEGKEQILDEALIIFNNIPKARLAIKNLMKINQQLKNYKVDIIYDLAELQTYEYHNGIIFSAYNINYSKALAQGGRYDNLSSFFGKQRAATGFSFDLKFLSQSK